MCFWETTFVWLVKNVNFYVTEIRPKTYRTFVCKTFVYKTYSQRTIYWFYFGKTRPYARDWQWSWIFSDSHLRDKGTSPNGPSMWQVRKNVRKVKNRGYFNTISTLFTTPYNQNLHNEGQRHMIEHIALKTGTWTVKHLCAIWASGRLLRPRSENMNFFFLAIH